MVEDMNYIPMLQERVYTTLMSLYLIGPCNTTIIAPFAPALATPLYTTKLEICRFMQKHSVKHLILLGILKNKQNGVGRNSPSIFMCI